MQYLPGLTVQCINPQCEARGHWLRVDITGFVSISPGPVRPTAAVPAAAIFYETFPRRSATTSVYVPALSPRARPFVRVSMETIRFLRKNSLF